MKSKIVVSVLARLATLSACGSLKKKSALINPGDQKAQVMVVMGPPQDRQFRDKNEVWQYCVTGAGFGYHDYRMVWFYDGRVTGITSYKNSLRRRRVKAISRRSTGKRRRIKQLRSAVDDPTNACPRLPPASAALPLTSWHSSLNVALCLPIRRSVYYSVHVILRHVSPPIACVRDPLSHRYPNKESHSKVERGAFRGPPARARRSRERSLTAGNLPPVASPRPGEAWTTLGARGRVAVIRADTGQGPERRACVWATGSPIIEGTPGKKRGRKSDEG